MGCKTGFLAIFLDKIPDLHKRGRLLSRAHVVPSIMNADEEGRQAKSYGSSCVRPTRKRRLETCPAQETIVISFEPAVELPDTTFASVSNIEQAIRCKRVILYV